MKVQRYCRDCESYLRRGSFELWADGLEHEIKTTQCNKMRLKDAPADCVCDEFTPGSSFKWSDFHEDLCDCDCEEKNWPDVGCSACGGWEQNQEDVCVCGEYRGTGDWCSEVVNELGLLGCQYLNDYVYKVYFQKEHYEAIDTTSKALQVRVLT